MKKLVIILVVVVVLGLVFVPQLTKKVMTITGGATLDTVKAVYVEVKESPEIKEKSVKFKEDAVKSAASVSARIIRNETVN